MASVRLTHQAEKDLGAVIEYYLNVGVHGFVDILEAELLEKLRSLESFPRMGREIPELGDSSMREVFVRNYRIAYHVDENDEEVTVLTIFHSSKELGCAAARSFFRTA